MFVFEINLTNPFTILQRFAISFLDRVSRITSIHKNDKAR